MEKILVSALDKIEVESNIKKEGLTFVDARQEPFALYGVFFDTENNRYARMPYSVACSVSRNVGEFSTHTAGGRIRFITDSPYVAIHMTTARIFRTSNHVSIGGFDLYEDEQGKSVYLGTFVCPDTMEDSFSSVVNFPADGKRKHSVTLNFPCYSDVSSLQIGLKEDSVLEPPLPYADELPFVYYGSSITHGCCASRPGNTYQAHISRRFNRDFINLGFSGSAKGEKIMAEYLAGLKMSLFIMDYDHNANDLAYLQATHEPFYQIIRKSHPDLPVIFVSKPDFSPYGEDAARREVIRQTYLHAKKQGERVWFVDGEALFAGDYRDACTVDGCHPNDLGFYRMSKVIGDAVAKALTEEKIKNK